jgi:hypothetical protein
MSDLRADVSLLLQLDQVQKPSLAARQFAHSTELANVLKNGRFFDAYSMDSVERFYINEMATYFETLGMLRSKGIVDAELALDWSGALTAWRVIGPVLLEAREVFGIPSLWIDFENLAHAQEESTE